MEAIKYAKLILDDPRDIYYSGQVLGGHVECEVTAPLSYSVINLNFIGEAKVFWTESDIEEYNGVRRQVTVKYSGQETYFNTMQCISGGMGVITLPPGKHQIPFQFQIPHTAPSTFTGEIGSVRYKVVAYIEYPDPTRQRDQLERAFEVVAPLDLNRIGNKVMDPIDMEFEEVYGCCCSSLPVTIRVHIPATGFCPGQAIPITVQVDNESSLEIKKIIFELIQKECYHSIEPKSDYIPPDTILESMKIGPILSRTKREYTYELIVPDFIAPNLDNCKIIDVGFFINTTIKLSRCKDDLKDEYEICLGLVPLTSLVENYTHPMQSDLPQAAIPDPSFVLASPIQTAQFQTSAIQNSTDYPYASPYPGGAAYPTTGGSLPYPNSRPSPYPTLGGPSPYPPAGGRFPNVTSFNNASLSIPMATVRTGNLGFIALPNNSPYPIGTAPYPGDNAAGAKPTSYSSVNNVTSSNNASQSISMATLRTGNLGFIAPLSNSPFPTGTAPYRGENADGANPAPYPSANNAPYPTANSAPYPISPASNSAPYPVGNDAPYPSDNAPHFGVNVPPPYPTGTAPYPGENAVGVNPAPYLSTNNVTSCNNASQSIHMTNLRTSHLGFIVLPSDSPYPTGTAPYPGENAVEANPAPYPSANNVSSSNNASQSIPMATLRTGNLDFIAPPSNSPFPTGTAPYPGEMAVGANPAPNTSANNVTSSKNALQSISMTTLRTGNLGFIAPPSKSPYPTGTAPYPGENAVGANPAPYPSANNVTSCNNASQSIPKATLRTGNLGFIVLPSNSPYPTSTAPYPGKNADGANPAPYPSANNAPYPTANNAPYPTSPVSNSAPYPVGNDAPYPSDNAPHFGANVPPYPPANSTPYPDPNSSPYLPFSHTPYPPGGKARYPPEDKAPYPPEGKSPYPPEGKSPYPPEGKSPYPPEGKSPYPPEGKSPYPPEGKSPYSPEGKSPYPPECKSPYPPEGKSLYPPKGNSPEPASSPTPL